MHVWQTTWDGSGALELGPEVDAQGTRLLLVYGPREALGADCQLHNQTMTITILREA